jgi:2-iminobutanoate/2-iminopropanoate deaminase
MAPRPQVVETPRVPRIGPYSQVMRVGSLLFTAGQPGIDPGTGAAAGETFEAQARQAIANLRAVLEDAGSGLERVVKTTCFVADATAFPKLNELYAEYFPSAPPVRSTPIVGLPRGLLFSIEAIALVGDTRRRPNKRLQSTRTRPRSRTKSARRSRPRG